MPLTPAEKTGMSKRTINRLTAKAEGRKPKRKPEQPPDTGGVRVKSPCGTPLWELPFETVEELEAAWAEARKADARKARKGGCGKKNPVKEKAVAEAKKHGISDSTIKRAISKVEGRKPKPKPSTQPKSTEPKAFDLLVRLTKVKRLLLSLPRPSKLSEVQDIQVRLLISEIANISWEHAAASVRSRLKGCRHNNRVA